MVAILELIWSQNPQIKMAVLQKLFKIQISNLSGKGTIGVKIKKKVHGTFWISGEMTWNDPNIHWKLSGPPPPS